MRESVFKFEKTNWNVEVFDENQGYTASCYFVPYGARNFATNRPVGQIMAWLNGLVALDAEAAKVIAALRKYDTAARYNEAWFLNPIMLSGKTYREEKG